MRDQTSWRKNRNGKKQLSLIIVLIFSTILLYDSFVSYEGA